MLGHEPTRGGAVLDIESAREMVRTLSAKHGLAVDPDTEVEDLPVGTQQRVEILKALSRKVDLLILDEPTAVLTPQETDELLGVMKELAASGTSIVFITHKLREVLAVSDRVYVLRQGAVVRRGRDEGHRRARARHADGRPRGRPVHRQGRGDAGRDRPGHHRPPRQGRPRPRRPSTASRLEVRAGEIVGVAGVEGNGQRELVEALAGMRKVVSGQMTAGRPGPHQGQPAPDPPRRASATSPRTARSTASSRHTPSPTTSCSTSSTRRPTPRAACGSSTRSARRRGGAHRVRHPLLERAPERGLALGRQQAEGRRRPRDVVQAPAAHGRPAHPWRRRRVDRVHPPPDRRRPRRRGRRAARVGRARRDPVARRPDRRRPRRQGRRRDGLRGADRTEIGRLMAGDH